MVTMNSLWFLTGSKPIRKLDGSLDALSVTAPHLQAEHNTIVDFKLSQSNC